MITVYTKNHCPYCTQAKRYLTDQGVEYAEINIEHDGDARQFLKDRGHTTVPQLYKGAELLVEGGYTGLVDLSEDELQRRCKVE